jgi:hypothetical protein
LPKKKNPASPKKEISLGIILFIKPTIGPFLDKFNPAHMSAIRLSENQI